MLHPPGARAALRFRADPLGQPFSSTLRDALISTFRKIPSDRSARWMFRSTAAGLSQVREPRSA